MIWEIVMTKYLISFPILAILALLIYFFVIALVPLVAAIVPNGHALQEHGAGAISAGECFSGGGDNPSAKNQSRNASKYYSMSSP
jgi:hypothetical protein